jgi:hypothetical protein
MARVGGGEEENAVNIGQIEGVGATTTGVDVADHEGAGGGAVASPQLRAVDPVAGLEKQCTVDVGEMLAV